MHKNWQNAAKVVTSVWLVLICSLYPSDRKMSIMQKKLWDIILKQPRPFWAWENFEDYFSQHGQYRYQNRGFWGRRIDSWGKCWSQMKKFRPSEATLSFFLTLMTLLRSYILVTNMESNYMFLMVLNQLLGSM